MTHEPMNIRGFNLCESLLRHSPEQLRTFIRRMKKLNMNTIIIHYDYGWKRYKSLILEECQRANVEIILMTFGPRTFLSYSDWKPEWFAKKEDGRTPWTQRLECETFPCAAVPECLEAFEYGARQWLKELPPQIKHVHMRAADGILFCQCEACRRIPEHERWQPFVERFVKAVRDVRPELKYETDVYVMRYNIPEKHDVFGSMDNIMYDTFYRAPAFPLAVDDDICTSDCIPYAAGHTIPDAKTISRYHGKRLAEWSALFPRKLYIHENAMMQSYCGIFQHGTGSYLQDLALYRKLGIQGVCYEAFEPGFANFEAMFEVLARAMNGEDVYYELTPLERHIREKQYPLFCLEPDLELEKYIDDDFQLEQNQLFREYILNPTLELCIRWIRFAFENPERTDPLFIGYSCMKEAFQNGILRFNNLSEQASAFLERRKLWDFMEEIPLEQEPRVYCRKLIDELMENALPGEKRDWENE